MRLDLQGLKLKLLQAAVLAYRRLPSARLKRIVRGAWEQHQVRNRGRVVIATRDGLRYELHLDELIDNAIYYQGSFEAESTAAIRRLSRVGDVVLDIGANIGCHALRFARLVGPSGKVIAFEPMPWARRKLTRNLSLNDFSNITVVGDGLSDSEGSFTTHFRSSWKLTGAAASAEADDSTAPVEVHFRRLDDFLAASGVNRVDVVKLDVDGYEFKVLRGGINTLKTHRPRILIELGFDTLQHAGDSLPEMVSFLAALGYRFYRERDLREFESREQMFATIPQGGTINVVLSASPLQG